MWNTIYYTVGWLLWTILCRTQVPLDSWIVSAILGLFGIVVFWIIKHIPDAFDVFHYLD